MSLIQLLHIKRGLYRPVAERGALPPERAISGIMLFWRSFGRIIRILMLIRRTRGCLRNMGGRGKKIHNVLYQSILQRKYHIMMSKALCLQD